MWARPWPAGWHVPSMTTSQHLGMNDLSDTFKEQWSKITWGPWLPEVRRGTRSRHMMEEIWWLKENKQMWCQQLTTSRRLRGLEEKFDVHPIFCCTVQVPVVAGVWWSKTVAFAHGSTPFWIRHPFLFAQYLIYRPRHLPTEQDQRLESDRRPSTVRSRCFTSPQKVIKEIFFRVK